MKVVQVYLAVGLFALCTAGILAGVSALALATGPGNAAYAPAAGLCAVAFVVPGVAFFTMYRRARIRESGLEQVGALIQSYQVVHVREMAGKLGKSEADAEQLMALAIADGHARGRLDAKTGWFVAEGAPAELVREKIGET